MHSHDLEQQKSQTVRSVYGDEPQQFGDLYLPGGDGPYPVVLLIHGGFWRAPYDLSLMKGLALDLLRHGIAVWNIEYRRLGDVGGGWPGTFQDVAHAADHLKTLAAAFPLDLQRIVVVGHSAGGHLALWLAARKHMQQEDVLASSSAPLEFIGAISQAGVSDLAVAQSHHLGKDAVKELLGGGPDKVPERYRVASPTTFLPLGIPQVLIHGTQDDRVPLLVSQSYLAKAVAAADTVRLLPIEGADHFVLIDATSAVWSLTVTEIKKILFAPLP